MSLDPKAWLALGARLAHQPDQHLAQGGAVGDPFREIQPQRDIAGLRHKRLDPAGGLLGQRGAGLVLTETTT